MAVYNKKQIKGMKHLYILLAGLALCGSALTGCSEDYLLGEEGNTVNTETEADVPEGYVRVSFVPQEAMQTRAAVDGISNSIYRVQTLLYKDNALVETKQSWTIPKEQGWNGRIMEAPIGKIWNVAEHIPLCIWVTYRKRS